MAVSGAAADGKVPKVSRRPNRRPAKSTRKPAHKRQGTPAREADADPDAELYEQGDIATPRRDPPYEDGL